MQFGANRENVTTPASTRMPNSVQHLRLDNLAQRMRDACRRYRQRLEGKLAARPDCLPCTEAQLVRSTLVGVFSAL